MYCFKLGLKCYIGNENENILAIQDCSRLGPLGGKYCFHATSPSLRYFGGCSDIPTADWLAKKLQASLQYGEYYMNDTKFTGVVEIAGGLMQLKMCDKDLCNVDQGDSVK